MAVIPAVGSVTTPGACPSQLKRLPGRGNCRLSRRFISNALLPVEPWEE